MKYQLKILDKRQRICKKLDDVHIKEFKRLGVVGDFENYYSTMSFEAEAQIVKNG